jgi:sodium-dependent phosphate cotransporter
MVASGSIDLSQAIPMIMGANIGTTLTSNIVSLSFFSKKGEFRKAMSTSTIHNLFNILVTVIIFPLQYYYNFLGIISEQITHVLTFRKHTVSMKETLYGIVQHSRFSEFVTELIGNNIIVLVLSVILLFISIKLLSKTIYQLLIGPVKESFERYIFKNPFKSFGWGVAFTASIQSSSVTTSIIVPLVATRKVKLTSAFPFIMGANVGTTITAFLAALFKTETAVSIAMAHLLFNFIGVIVFLPFPVLRNVPIVMAKFLGSLFMRYRIISLVYIILIFFLLPFAFIYLSR